MSCLQKGKNGRNRQGKILEIPPKNQKGEELVVNYHYNILYYVSFSMKKWTIFRNFGGKRHKKNTKKYFRCRDSNPGLRNENPTS